MRTQLAAMTLFGMSLIGCNSGDIPTPVPDNTPLPSATDVPPPEGAPADSGRSEVQVPRDTPPPSEPPPTEPPPTEPTPMRDDAPGDPPDVAPTPGESTSSDEVSATGPKSAPSPESQLAQLNPQQLVERLGDADERDLVTRALVAKGSAAVEPLMAALNNESWEVRASAVFSLGQMGAAARPALARLKEVAQSDEVPAVRDAAAFAIDTLQQ